MTIYLEVDKSFAKLYDELIYTVTIKNEGQKIDSLRIVSPFDEMVTFKWVKMNESLYNDQSIAMEGFLIKNLQRWEEVKIAFIGVLTDFPRENPITHIADVYYNVGKEAYVLTSNAVITYVVDANMSYQAGTLLLEGNQGAVNKGDHITYKLWMVNKGNRKAEQILIGPLAPEGTYLLPETIKCLEGKITLTKEESLYIEELEIGEVRTCFYTVKVEEYLGKKEVTQTLHMAYRLTYPNRQSVVQRIQTNSVEIPIETVYFKGKQGALRKEVSLALATEGDLLTYILEGCNVGTVTSCGMQVIDYIPDGTRWIEESLIVNGQKQYSIQEEPSRENNRLRVMLPDCLPGEIFSMSYEVEVLGTFPLQEVLQTRPLLTYWYGVGERMVEEEVDIGAEGTHVVLACIDPLKNHLIEGFEEVITLGETVTAFLSLINKGNEEAREVEVLLDLPKGVVLGGEGWTETEGKFYKTYQEPLGPHATYIEPLVFEIVDISPPLQAFIGVQVIYTYKMGEERVEKVSAQEEIPIYIEAAYISMKVGEVEKYFVPGEVCVGEEVCCTFTLTNRGNMSAYEVVIEEEDVEGLEFLEPREGRLYVEKLEPEETRTITYRAQVVGLPPSGAIIPLSQISYSYTTSGNKFYRKESSLRGEGIQVVDAYISPFIKEEGVQQVEREAYAKGDVIHYALPITHLGNVRAENITLSLPHLEEGIWQNNNPIIINQLMPGEHLVLNYYLEITQVPTLGVLQVVPLFNYDFKMQTLINKERRKIGRSYTLEPIEVLVQYAAIEEGYGLTRSVDTDVTPLNEVVYYTINLKNTGNVKALEVRIQEEVGGGCTYESGTLTLNGVALDYNPLCDNLFIGNLEPGESYHIRYGVRVNQVPLEGYFYTRSLVTYAYYVGTCMRNQKVVTESICVKVEDTDIHLVTGIGGYNLTEQSIDLDESFNFDVTIEAKGNVEAYNVYYLIEGEGINFDPPVHLRPTQIPILSPNETRVIGAVGKVKEFVQDGKLSIRGKLCYEFGSGVYKRQRTLYTEEQHLYIYGAGPLTPESFELVMNKKVVHIGERIALTFRLLGEGNCPMEDTRLFLKGFEEVGFQIEKVYSDKEVLRLKHVGEHLNLGTVYPGQKEEITIEGYMTHIPKDPLCQYEGLLTYSYLSATSKGRKKASHSTGENTFIFKESGLSHGESVTLSGDKKALRKGESILYTLKMYNDGNVKTEKIKIQLAIDERLEIEPLLYSVKGSTCTGNLLSGLYIEALECGQWVEIQFKATLKTLIPKEDLEVAGTVIYEYEDGEGILKICEKDIPPYFISIESADFGSDYFGVVVDKKEVAQGQVIHCQVHCENGGNKKAEAVKLHLEWPSTFAYEHPLFPSKEKIDKKGQIEIGTLGPMEKRLITFDLVGREISRQEEYLSARITYKDKGETIQLEPIYTPLYCVCPLIEMTYQLDAQRGIIGENVECTVQVINKGNRKVETTTFLKLLPPEIHYIEGSLKIDGRAIENETLEEGVYKVEGLQLGMIEEGQTLTLTYTGQIKRMPLEGVVKSEPQLRYSYILNEQIEEVEVSSKGLELLVEAPSIQIQKQCSKQKVDVGEEVEVNVKLTNTGSIDLDQILFYDQIPEGILFVEGSFKRDGKRQGIVDLRAGVGLGPLKKKGQLFISYKLRIQSYIGPEWIHQVYTEYLFNKANLKISKKTSETVVDTLQVTSPYNVPLVYETQIFLAYDAPDLCEILQVEVSADILEGYRLPNNPKEAEIKGILNYIITYRGKEENRQIEVKKVWGKRIELVSPITMEPLKLQVETEKVAYAIVHKRALKVEVGLKVSEV